MHEDRPRTRRTRFDIAWPASNLDASTGLQDAIELQVWSTGRPYYG